jgi:exopolysaccharide production protein ExoZ
MNKKLQYLQIARGIAALMVVLHHTTASAIFYLKFTPLNNIFKAGWNGVDFFFVLSGFIIYYIHSDDIGHPDRTKKFIYKRFIRIYPIYWVIATVALALIVIANKHVSNIRSLEPIYLAKSFLLIAQVKEPFLGVAWSLCFELFFYFLFALGILLGSRFFFFILSGYFILLGCQVVFKELFNNSFYLSFLSSNFHLEFIFGILTSICYKRFLKNDFFIERGKLMVRMLLVLGIALFLVAWICSYNYELSFGKFSINSRLIYGLSSGIIIFSIAMINMRKENWVSNSFLLLGDSSYVLYLVHPLVLAIFFKIVSTIHRAGALYYYGICLFAFIASIAAGLVVHVFLERKILKILNKRLLKKGI